jgi:hypothetical protein
LTSLGASKELEKMEIILGVEMDSTLIIVRLVENPIGFPPLAKMGFYIYHILLRYWRRFL